MTLKQDLKPREAFSQYTEASSRGVIKLLQLLLQGYGLLLGFLCVVIAEALHSEGVAVVWVFILAEIGAVLISTGLFVLAFESVLRDHHLRIVLDALRTVMGETWRGYTSLRSIGIKFSYECLPAEYLRQLFLKAKSIRILKTWHLEDTVLESGLKEALSRRGEPVRLDYFLCHHSSKILHERGVGAGEEAGVGIQRNRRLVEQMAKWIHSQGTSTVSLTFYDAWPGAPLIQCDEILLVGFFPRGLSSPSAPWLEVDIDSVFGRELLAQFNFSSSEIKAVLRTKEDFDDWSKNGWYDPASATKPVSSVGRNGGANKSPLMVK